MGQRMEKTHQSKRKTTTGFEQILSHYQARNCEGCPMRSMCHGSKRNRSIERNHNLERHREKARELLMSCPKIALHKKV
jgi:radical SAM protein with 4Fe4S-binding SPASM domain